MKIKNKKIILITLSSIILIASGIFMGIRLNKNNQNPDSKTENIETVKFIESEFYLYPEEDNDEDLLNNEKEESLGTDPLTPDTDKDHIIDGKEIEIGTDLLEPDTDGDKIIDGCELVAGTDPLTPDDYKKNLTINIDPNSNTTLNLKKDKAQLQLKDSDANGYASVLSAVNNSSITLNPDTISNLYQVNLSGENSSAELKIDISNVSKANKDNLAMYEYSNNTFTKVESVIENNSISCNVLNDKFYVLGVDNLKTEHDTHITFVIDDSGSMYDEGNAGEPGNDPDFIRYNMVYNIADKLGVDKYHYSLYTFSGSCWNVVDDTNDLTQLQTAINTAKNDRMPWTGTDIGKATNEAIEGLKDETDVRKIIIVLSDGEDTSGSDLASTGRKAYYNKILAITIGLGSQTDASLSNIASYSTGFSYFAKDANCLSNVVNKIKKTIDVDDSNRMLIADSGFDPEINGFSFTNYTTDKEEGQCFGMATFANKYYTGSLDMEFEGSDKRFALKSINGSDSDPYTLENTTLWDMYESNKPLHEWNTSIDTSKPINMTFDVSSIEDKIDVDKIDINHTKPTDIVDLIIDDIKEEKGEKYADSWQVHSVISSMFNWQYTNDAEEMDLHKSINFKQMMIDVAQGIPVVIGMRGPNDRGHAVNICKIEQDANDANTYYFGIYENSLGKMTWAKFVVKPESEEFRYNFEFNCDQNFEFIYNPFKDPDAKDVKEGDYVYTNISYYRLK